MLIEQGHAAFVAICEDCEETSSPIGASREVAVLRLMRARWRLKSFGDRATRTWCPSCQTVPSVSTIRAAEEAMFDDEEPPTLRRMV
jgi:hypothetical protein